MAPPFSYGVPVTKTSPTGAPRCWGNASEYNNESTECKQCGYQQSCRSEINRKSASRDQTTEYYSNFMPVTQTRLPVIQPLRVPGAVAPPPMQAPAPSAQFQFRPPVGPPAMACSAKN
jgi:hypothetical protein